MNKTLIRSFCAVAFAALTACAPGEEGKIPCSNTGNCPSEFPTCSTGGFCVAFSPAVKLVAISGTGQASAVAGNALPAPLVVSAQDVNNAGVPGVAITWAVTVGGGTITGSSTTGADGTASVTPTLGNTVGDNIFSATAAGLNPGSVNFTEASIAGPTTNFLVSFPPSVATLVSSTATVTPKDKNGNLSNYTGSVAVTLGKPDPIAVLPAPTALSITPAAPGSVGGITFKTPVAGQTVIITDTTTASITGSSAAINVAISGTITTLASSLPAGSVFGQPVKFTATVAPTSSGSAVPTGTVNFFSNNVSIGSATLVGGSASVTTSALPVGNDSITANYLGDTSFAASATANPLIQVVGKANSSVALAPLLPVATVFGQTATFTATVSASGLGAGTPSGGTVTLRDGATTVGSCTGLTAAAVSTCTVSTLAVGNHTMTAIYAGDTNFNASSASNAVTQAVNKAATTITLGATTASVFGQAVTFTATIAITAPGAGTPTGTVAFFNGTATVPGNQIACTAGGAVTGGTTATCTTSGALPVSTTGLSINATYSGDGSFATSTTATAATQVVNKAATTVTVASDHLTSVFGQLVTFSATITPTPPGAGTPGGTLDFQESGVDISGCGAVAVGSTCSIANLGIGTHSITVTYSGNGNFTVSTSPAISQVVNKAATTVALTPLTPPAVTIGTSVLFTATISVTAPGSGTPGGNMEFQNNGVDIATCVSQPVNTKVATCTIALPVGTNVITAIYPGDTNFTGFTSNSVTQTVNKGTTTVNVLADVPASVFGQAVTFTASISRTPSSLNATGSVVFKDGPATTITCAVAGQGTVVSNQATCTTSTLSNGSHSITAVYGGDGNFTGNTSPITIQLVTAASTITGPVSFAPPTPNFGDTVTLSTTINVNSPGAGPATGNVTFSDGATVLGGSCTGAIVNASSVATCTISTLTAGTHPMITAAYTNVDGNFTASNSALTPTPITIGKANSAITAFNFNQGATGHGTFSATVTGNAAGAPLGTVNFSQGANITSCTLSATATPGVSSCLSATASVPTGSQTFKADYAGDTNYNAATQVSTTVTVTALPPPGTAVVIDGGPASGKVLVVSGDSQATTIYDPATSVSSAGPMLTAARAELTATAIGNGQVLLAGGNAKGGSTFEVCTVASCSAVRGLSTQRCNAAAARVGESVLIAGGDNCAGTALASWDLWSAGGVTSSTAANQLSEARASLTATLVADGTVLLAGGGSRTAELFKDSSVIKLPSMLAARTGHTATLLPAGSKACASGSCVFLAGGVNSGATWEAFDVAAGTFGRPASAVEMLNPQRAFQAAALLAGGRVLLAGGLAGNDAIETSEIFDGARFAYGPALQTARTGVASAYVPSLDLLMLSAGKEAPELLTAP